MADDGDNLVLRLLREIRGELAEVRQTQAAHGERLTRIDRSIDDLRETAITAMGYAAHSALITDKAGERFDRITDEIAALKRRVADLEARGTP